MTDPLRPPLYPAEKVSPTTVLVTGATGYFAGSLVQRLLAAGHTVHATARTPDNERTVGHLQKLPGADQRLKLFKADLLSEGSFSEAMQGCTVVFHTASPFIGNAGYGAAAQKALVDPAVKGTENVLNSAEATPTVRRVVLTSSCAAIYHGAADLPPGEKFTEEIWNTRSSLSALPYCYSKTMAEKKAWELAEKATHWDLVVMNPGLIWGPTLSSRADGESVKMIQMMFSGMMALMAPKVGFGVVDVRDVAAAHCLGAFIPTAKGRYILAPNSALLTDLLAIIHNKYPKVPVHRMFAPKWLLYLVGPLMGMPRDVVSAYVDQTPYFTVDKARRELGLEFIPLEDTVIDMAESCIKFGIVKPSQ